MDWNFIDKDDTDIESKCEIFMSVLSNAVMSAFPVLKKGNKGACTQVTWFNKNIKQMREYLQLVIELNKAFLGLELDYHIKSYKVKYI